MAFATHHVVPRIHSHRKWVQNTPRTRTNILRIANVPALRKRSTIIATSSPPSSSSQPTDSGAASKAEQPASSVLLEEPEKDVPPFDWLNQWYPIYIEDDVELFKSYSVTVWNKPLVLFQDAFSDSPKRYVVLDDFCSHRAAALSEGRVIARSPKPDAPSQTVIECAYHGWKFDCAGKCVDVPTIPIDGPIRPRAHLRPPYPVHVAAGIIFAWLGDSDPVQLGRPVPDVPDEMNRLDLRGPSFRRLLPFDVATLLENVADPAHIPWPNLDIQENQYKTSRDGKVTLSLKDMASGTFVATIEDKKVDFQEMTYRAPALIDVKMHSGTYKARVCFWATPVKPDQSMLFRAISFLSLPVPVLVFLKTRARYSECLALHSVLDRNAPLLYRQHARLRSISPDPAGKAWTKEYHLPRNDWDTLALTTRKFFLTHADSMPQAWIQAWKDLPPVQALRKEVTMDRFYSHTVHCTACTRALQQTRWIRFFASIVAGCMTIICICGGLVAVVVASAATGLAAGAGAHANSIITAIASVALITLLVSLITVKIMADREKLFIFTKKDYEKFRTLSAA